LQLFLKVRDRTEHLFLRGGINMNDATQYTTRHVNTQDTAAYWKSPTSRHAFTTQQFSSQLILSAK